MGNSSKLPVFAIVGEAFTFASRKFISLILLNTITFALLLGPVVLLIVFFFQEYYNELASNTGALNDIQLFNIRIRMHPVEVFYRGGALLMMPIIHTTIIQSITRGDRLMLPKLNRDVLRYLATTAIVGALIFAAASVASAGLSFAFVGASHLSSMNEEIVYAAAALLAALLIYLSVRLSLVPTEVITRSKLGITRGFEMTRGHFWRLFCVFLVTVPLLLLLLVGFGFLMAQLLGPAGFVEKLWMWQIPGTDQAYFLRLPDPTVSLLSVALYIAKLLLSIYTTSVLLAATAFAYLHLSGARDLAYNEDLH